MVGEGVQGIGRAGETMGNKAAAISEKIFAQQKYAPLCDKMQKQTENGFWAALTLASLL